jgi:hypothetical protein
MGPNAKKYKRRRPIVFRSLHKSQHRFEVQHQTSVNDWTINRIFLPDGNL